MSNKLPRKIRDRIAKYPPFYQKVWIECFKIPEGSTVSYSQLAKQIGSPGAARAVGQALKNNPFAPVIPCHRVIRSDGRLGGYSAGGLSKKRILIEREKSKKYCL